MAWLHKEGRKAGIIKMRIFSPFLVENQERKSKVDDDMKEIII